MATRVGIELSPAACRIIEIEGGLPWVRRAPETRVLSFEILPPAGPETLAKLKALRKRSVAAVVWGVPTDHRQVIVSNRSYETMRREALAALAAAGIDTRGVLADIAPVSEGNDRSPRRPVTVALAASAPMMAALTSLTNLGIRVRSVLTPAAALTSLARTRRMFAVRGSIEAYVALDTTATCIALVRDGALITARELSWGYVDDVRRAEPRRLDDIVGRLAGELSEFVGAIGASASAVSQVCVCGGLPDLRSMTARLTEKLDIEVEPLDSLDSLDPEPLLERADDFRERCAELRVAWAAATDWPPAINLLRARKRQATKTALSRAAIIAGAAAGLGIGWQVQQSAWWRSRTPKPAARTASNVRPPVAATPPVATTKLPTPAPPPVTAMKPAAPALPPVTATKPPTPTPPVAARSTPPVAQPPVAKTTPLPAVQPPTRASDTARGEPERVQMSRAATKPADGAPPAATPRTAPTIAPPLTRPQPPVPPPSVARKEDVRPEPAPRRQVPVRTPPPEIALPFEASLGTILYSSDRKLAIIDGRIVGVGDEVRGARVTDITPTAVFVRDVQGKLRRLTVATGR